MFTLSFKRKPKTKITLQQFYDAVNKVAKDINESYVSVKVEMCNGRLELWGYINGVNWVQGKTIEEVCDNLRNYKKEKTTPSPVKEISI